MPQWPATHPSAEILFDTVDGIEDGAAVYDSRNRLLMFNHAYTQYFTGAKEFLEPGISFREIFEKLREGGRFEGSRAEQDAWVENRIRMFEEGTRANEFQQAKGRWVSIDYYKMKRGGTLVICTDITERKKSEVALLDAKRKAEEADRAKSDFLSSISHELRTPLNAIIGFTQMLQMDTEEPLTSRQQSHVKHIADGSHLLLELVNGLLDLASISAGKMIINCRAIDPTEIIDESLSLIANLAETNDVRASFESGGATSKDWTSSVLADPVRYKQILLNLLSNAVKYNRKGGAVTVALAIVENRRLRTFVEDTGPGIPQDQLDRLFISFDRLGAERSDILGSGIGLTVSKQLLELMDGQIGVESEVGRGTKFWFDLPLADA